MRAYENAIRGGEIGLWNSEMCIGRLSRLLTTETSLGGAVILRRSLPILAAIFAGGFAKEKGRRSGFSSRRSFGFFFLISPSPLSPSPFAFGHLHLSIYRH